MEQGLKNKVKSSTALIILAYIAFISLGLPDGLLGVAWPTMRLSFSRSLDSLGLMLLATTTGYLISSFYSGHIMSRLGIGWLLSLSCGATGAGLLGYTLIGSWWLIIPLAVIAGLGAGAIDAGINTYVASNFGERLMQWLHASYGIGITLGPIIMTMGLNLFSSWKWGYILVGTAQLALALCFGLTHSVWQSRKSDESTEIKENLTDYKTPLLHTLRELNVWISILMFFVYAGIEASLGTWCYTLLTESRGISSEMAGLLVGSYWATFTIGRVLAGLFTKYISIESLIKISLLGAFAGAVLLIWNPTKMSSLWSVAIIGFAIAPIFPGMVSLTSRRVSPKHTANTIGMQISTSGLGIALIPGLTGVLAQRTSLEVIPYLTTMWVVLLFILFSFSIKTKRKIKGQGLSY
ncbi:MAG: MFS transporter [Clostridiales bacterium]